MSAAALLPLFLLAVAAPAPASTGASAAPAARPGAPWGPAAPRFDPSRPFGSRAQAATPAPATPGHAPAAAPPTAVPPAPAAAAPGADAPAPDAAARTCTRDAQCPERTICDEGVCRAFARETHILLYRKDGPRTQFLPLYWARRGNPGYRVVAPLYFHFWGPEERTRIFAPFYFHFEDHRTRRVTTVVWAGLPVSWTSEPGASSWGIWPLYYRSTRFGWAAPLLGSFRINQPARDRAYGLYGLLYYWSREDRGRRAFDLLPPLFVSSRGRDTSFTWVLPLNFHWRAGRERNLLVPPLFFHRSSARGGVLATPLGYRHRTGESSRGSLLWLYWYGRDADRRAHDVLFPLLWSFRTPGASTTVLPPLLHLRRPTWSFTTLFPLFFRGQSRDEAGAPTSSWNLVLPLYFARDRGARQLWLTPLGGGLRDRETDTHRVSFWLPPILLHRERDRQFDMVLGLYWRVRDPARDLLVAGPFYRARDPGGSTTALFPLYWRFHDQAADARATLLLPFYFHRSAPGERLTAAGVLPLWLYHRDRGAAGRSFGLAPLAFFGRDSDRRHAVVLPLFWHTADRERSFTLALPLFYHYARRQDGRDAGARADALGLLPLLYFQGRDARTSYRVQFPLFWRFSDHASGSTTTVVPPGFWRKDPHGFSGGLFPLLFAGRHRAPEGARSHLVLFPLFWRFSESGPTPHAARETLVVGNYLYRRHGEQTTHALFPLFHLKRGAPPGGENETSVTLFPLLHYRRTSTSRLLLSPVAAWSERPDRQAGFVLPYFWYRDRDVTFRGVPPLWLDVTSTRDRQRTRVLGPFIAVDAPDGRARFLLPFFGRYESRDETGMWAAPTYFRMRRRDGFALDTLFPLFWRSRSPGHATLQIGPWFSRRTRDSYATGLLPLYLYARDRAGSLLVTPLSFRKADFKAGTSTHWAGLLFFRSTRPGGGRTILFPLWFSGHDRAGSHQVLFPLYWRVTDHEKDTHLTVLGPWFHRRAGSAWTTGLFPLAWVGRDPARNAGSHTLVPLFHHAWSPGSSTLLTPVFGRGLGPAASWWYVPPVFHRSGNDASLTVAFPVWLSHTQHADQTRTRIFLPLLHFSRQTPESGLSSWLALYWRHRGIATATTVVFPLFFDRHSYHDSRTTALLPLFLRHHRAADDTTYTLAPLFYRRSDPASATTVLFPFYWDFKGPDRRTSLLLPVFGRVDRPGFTATYVFPTFYYRAGKGQAEGTYRFVFFPLWESAAKRRGDRMWEVLLGLFGYERIGRSRFLKLLFIPFEIEPVPQAQTAGYGGARSPRRHAPARGFSGHVW